MSGTGLTYMMEAYNHFMETKSDPRVTKWLLMSSPAPLLTILATYIYFCVYAGPRYMKDRKPFELKNVIIFYNFAQILMSIFLLQQGIKGGWFTGYSFTCQPVDYSDSPQAMTMAGGVWWYFFCKITELLDTVFFILRKKNKQVTFLHVYHHGMMPICAWIGVRFLPGGHGTLLGLINSFIHVIMYSYYMFSSMGPQYQKYLWWKKHLTILQIIQFFIITVHVSQPLYNGCNYPKIISFLLTTQAMFFIVLFSNFYLKTYNKNNNKKTAEPISNGVTKHNDHAITESTAKTYTYDKIQSSVTERKEK